jgi:hypothetical protein
MDSGCSRKSILPAVASSCEALFNRGGIGRAVREKTSLVKTLRERDSRLNKANATNNIVFIAFTDDIKEQRLDFRLASICTVSSRTAALKKEFTEM